MIKFHIGPYIEVAIDWLKDNLGPFFDLIKLINETLINGLENLLLFIPSILLILIFTATAWKLSGKKVAIFTFLGLLFIDSIELWPQTMGTLSLISVSALISLLIGVPLGIWASRHNKVDKVLRPILDFMQTMPAFVYLIPAVLFFGMGKVPGAIATIIFSMPPAVRLTNLGIRQVPEDVIEASKSFGSTKNQMLFKVQLPIALPTILAGINQTIMLSLSMVVISAMIGAGGLGREVLSGIQQMEVGVGFESGLAVVILAMILDRITQSLGKNKSKEDM
ncbi:MULTISPECIES: ABC transporter permease [Clostridium]|jgi:glycine betaine/proline transport system permease protein|uniref:Glycine betaine transport system permease protein OpuAB n=2 Tax=Clostridium TaxID=1485 RepID=A0A151AQ69_9CLOT|nr:MULTISPECIES: proline/glycine betaine ABC transporter permease [Clostridium]KYH29547.1 glycine betaine transport system permease protein OpuAB [Clostridium colicanis DSM 13634]MBE6043867.1 proline/glycine betaine ABC transporter permease [Clostridium thermopalmarium]PRR72871.1 Glycine betaine transport system permease protein OpuAB [Clostridium thermopalmarium DSM 5974]PVZ21116.1 glycine betaine/proline transport system permease protein [Clostridium thermopalmarium DSM 5974]